MTFSLNLGFTVFAVICAGIALGMLFGRLLPRQHLDDHSRSVITVATAVVGTASALVLGLLISTASTSFVQRSGEVVRMATDIIRLDRILRSYGPGTETERGQLARYASVNLDDLFPNGSQQAPVIDDPAMLRLLDDIRNEVLSLKPADDGQRWRQDHALRFVDELTDIRWTLALQQNINPLPVPFLVMLVFWLTLLFGSFGLFAPRNTTVLATLALCAIAVSAGVSLVVDMTDPFSGFVRVSSTPLRQAAEVIGR